MLGAFFVGLCGYFVMRITHALYNLNQAQQAQSWPASWGF